MSHGIVDPVLAAVRATADLCEDLDKIRIALIGANLELTDILNVESCVRVQQGHGRSIPSASTQQTDGAKCPVLRYEETTLRPILDNLTHLRAICFEEIYSQIRDMAVLGSIYKQSQEDPEFKDLAIEHIGMFCNALLLAARCLEYRGDFDALLDCVGIYR